MWLPDVLVDMYWQDWTRLVGELLAGFWCESTGNKMQMEELDRRRKQIGVNSKSIEDKDGDPVIRSIR